MGALLLCFLQVANAALSHFPFFWKLYNFTNEKAICVTIWH